MLRFHTVCDQPRRLRALTGLPSHEFLLLAHVFDHMFERRMQTETLDGYQREGRSYTTYANCPLPTPEDKLLFILTYLKQNTTQEVHGQLFGMTQSNVSKWYRILAKVLQRTLQSQNVVPARTCDDLMQLLGKANGSSEASSDQSQSSENAPHSAEPTPFLS